MRAHEIEDLGAFGVWWYQLGPVVRWAYAVREGEAFRLGDCVGGFESRDAAIADAREATGAE